MTPTLIGKMIHPLQVVLSENNSGPGRFLFPIGVASAGASTYIFIFYISSTPEN